jgi:hypothetical protein
MCSKVFTRRLKSVHAVNTFRAFWVKNLVFTDYKNGL